MNYAKPELSKNTLVNKRIGLANIYTNMFKAKSLEIIDGISIVDLAFKNISNNGLCYLIYLGLDNKLNFTTRQNN